MKNKFAALHDEVVNQEGMEEPCPTWPIFLRAITETAEEVVPRKMKVNKEWMTEEIMKRIDKRRNEKRDSDRYRELNKGVGIKCREEREKWWNERCAEIESRPPTAHTQIKTLKRKTCSGFGYLKAKNGNFLMEEDDILQRWSEYIGDLFHDTRGKQPVIHKNIDGPPILESEICAAIKKAKLRKAPGPDVVNTEMLKVLVTDIANEICNKGEFPTDLSKSVFITLPKKTGAIECELHRTISLMSHVTKLILLVLLQRIRGALSPEMADVQ